MYTYVCAYMLYVLQDSKDEQRRKQQLQRDKKLKSLHNLKSDAEKRTRQFEQKVCRVHLLEFGCHIIYRCNVIILMTKYICTCVHMYLRMYVGIYIRVYFTLTLVYCNTLMCCITLIAARMGRSDD